MRRFCAGVALCLTPPSLLGVFALWGFKRYLSLLKFELRSTAERNHSTAVLLRACLRSSTTVIHGKERLQAHPRLVSLFEAHSWNVAHRGTGKFEGPWFTTQLVLSSAVGLFSFLVFSYCRTRWPVQFAPRTKLKGGCCPSARSSARRIVDLSSRFFSP